MITIEKYKIPYDDLYGFNLEKYISILLKARGDILTNSKYKVVEDSLGLPTIYIGEANVNEVTLFYHVDKDQPV